MVFHETHHHTHDHAHHTDSSFAAESFSVPIYNNNNLQYYGQVDIGTNLKGKSQDPFNVILDTGSSKLWVPSSSCTSSVCRAHHQFDPDSSSTYRASSQGDSSMTYGTGVVRVTNGTDVVSMGGNGIGTDPSAHPLGLALSESAKPFGKLKTIDGIFGMAPTTPVAQKLFSVYLSNDTAKPGALSVGSIDTAHSSPGTPTWHRVHGDQSWNIDLVDIKVGDTRLGVCPSDKPCVGLVDSGSSLVTGPSKDVARLLSKIHPTCGTDSNAEPVSLILKDESGNEVEYPLDPKEYSIDFRDTKECNIGFGALDLGKKKWVIGDTFLRRYLSIFDKANHRVGFIKSKHDDESIGVVTRGLVDMRELVVLAESSRERIQRIGSDFLFN
jgi:hypothetical protein